MDNSLSKCIQNKDLKGLNDFESEFKGVPGFGHLRERAKNEAKKLMQDSNID